MNFFIVDNGSLFVYEIAKKLKDAGHNVQAQVYSPHEPIKPIGADVIILSGGMQNEVNETLEDSEPYYRHEFELIRTTNTPILGICLGLQMINVALGGSLMQLPFSVETSRAITINDKGRTLLGYDHISCLEIHNYVVDSYKDTGLVELATSQDGIEMLYYPDRNILGTQFHPEIFVNDTSEQLLFDLIGLIHRPKGS